VLITDSLATSAVLIIGTRPTVLHAELAFPIYTR